MQIANKTYLQLGSLIAALAVSISSYAQPIPIPESQTQTQYFGSVNSPITAGTTTNLTFTAFDTWWGPLTGVTISLYTTMGVEETTVGYASDAFSSATATANVYAVGPDGTSATNTLTAGPYAGTIASQFVIQTNGMNSGNGVPYPDTESVSEGQLGYYDAGGTFSIAVESPATSDSGVDSVQNTVFFGGLASSYGEVVLTYDYVSLPEPSTIALAGLGLAGLVTFRRRK